MTAVVRLLMRHMLSDGTYTNSFLAVRPCQCSGLVPSRRPQFQIAAVTVHAKSRVLDMQAVPVTASGTVARTHCTALDSICAQVIFGEMALGVRASFVIHMQAFQGYTTAAVVRRMSTSVCRAIPFRKILVATIMKCA